MVSAGPLPAAPLPPPKPKRRTGLVVGVVVAAVLVVVAAIVAIFLINGSESGDRYPVGSCVVRDGASAHAAPCGQDGTYRVVKAVDRQSQCPDPNGPALVLQGADGPRVRCLTKQS